LPRSRRLTCVHTTQGLAARHAEAVDTCDDGLIAARKTSTEEVREVSLRYARWLVAALTL
jgi:hypothetical protein